MKPVVIQASHGNWIDPTEINYPQEENGYPFWAVLEDAEGGSRRELVVMTIDDGLCLTDDALGERYGDPVTEKVVFWMPQHIPMLPTTDAKEERRLWLVQGRECGDDDDTTDVFWASEDESPTDLFLKTSLGFSESEINKHSESETEDPLFIIVRCEDITDVVRLKGAVL